MPSASDHARYVTDVSWEMYRGDGDPEQRFRLYRLCDCEVCEGRGKSPALSGGSPLRHSEHVRCPECRGEGKVRELVATAGTPEAVGVALVTLGREGEWDECPVGVLDTEGEKGQKWIVRPWLPSTRNVSDAGRLLRTQRPDLAGSEIRKKADRR